jgi:outer membrane protein assembly factor BamB
MRTPKCTYAIIAIILALLMIFSAYIEFSKFTGSTVSASMASTKVNTATDYGDLLQYEWPQLQGDSSFTRFSAGPAPEAPDIMWKTNITGIQSYVSAFNGKVFVATKTALLAIDKDTGNILWNTTLPAPGRWPAVYKIDDTRLIIGNSCLDIETGKVLWVSDKFSAKVANWADATYSIDEKVFYNQGDSTVQAWNFSDPSKPPTLVWEVPVPGSGASGTGIQYGDGKVFPGSFEPHQMALDAKTGNVIWDTETKGVMAFSGSYYNGKLLKAGEHDNTFYCFDADTGKILWTFNPGTQFGYWVSGCATAYDMVYELNKDGYLYALDVDTGQLVWKYKGPGFLYWPGWPVVADGKVYATTGQRASIDPITGEYSKSEFVCLDAYTGSLLWKLPIEAYTPRESVAIAYGNLYLIPGYIEEDTMDTYITLDQVWAIGTQPWPMWRHDPAHTGGGQSGPANLTLRWNFTTGGGVISSPSVVDGKVYVGSQDKKVYCLDDRSGSLVWNFTTGSRIKSSPAVVDGKVYVGPDDGYVYCLDAKNGSLIWNRYAGGYTSAHFDSVARISSSPTVVGGKVYVGSLDNNTYCLDANSGNIIWTFKTAGYITSSPAVVDGAVYITSQEPNFGALYKLDADTSNLIWKRDIPYVLKSERGTDMFASPTVANGMVFLPTNKDCYFGINATTGEIKWNYTVTFSGVSTAGEFLVGSVAYNDGRIFLIDQFFVSCVNATNGKIFWKSWLGGEIYDSPSYADGKVYIASDRRVIYVINATTGERLSYFETGSNCGSSPTLYEGRVYVGNNDWNVYCLAEYPALNSSLTIELAKPKIVLGESVTGSGHLVPGMANAPIMLAFVKPDGTVIEVQVATVEKGAFNFTYTPDAIGNWTVTTQWQSDRGYYSSAYSKDRPIEVVAAPTPPPPPKGGGTGIPTEYFYATVAAVVILAIAIAALVLRRRAK